MNTVEVPILGYANAGEPLAEAESDYIGVVKVDESKLNGSRKVFGLEVQGNSMNRKIMNGVPIEDGSLVIISKDREFKNGDVVLALIDNGATIKTLKKTKKGWMLAPDSSEKRYKEIELKDDPHQAIAGRVITVLSKPESREA